MRIFSHETKGVHAILHTLGAILPCIFRDFAQISRDFAKVSKVFTDFSQISADFSQILRDFARIFIKSKLLGVHLYPRFLHNCF